MPQRALITIQRRLTAALLKGVVCAAVAIVIANVSGCMIVPPLEDPPYTGEALDFMQTGITGKAEVLSYFSEHHENAVPATFGNDSVWVYSAVYYGWGFVFCGVGAPGIGCGGLGDTDYFFLVIHFSDDGTVSSYEIFEEGDECQESDFCAVKNNFRGYMVLADKDIDRDAKNFSAPDSGCAIYIYTTDPPKLLLPLNVFIDGIRSGSITDESGFFRREMSTGEHQISAHFPSIDYGDKVLRGIYVATISFHCAPGQLVFLHAHLPSIWSSKKFTIQVEDEQLARQHISERSLALLPDTVDNDR